MTKIILLVEDNPDDIDLTLRAFKKNNILNEIIVVRDGAEAIDYLMGLNNFAQRDRNIMPALILLDLKLPKVNGLEVLRRLRAEECYPTDTGRSLDFIESRQRLGRVLPVRDQQLYS